jgi:predicted nucleic acid-binding protein
MSAAPSGAIAFVDTSAYVKLVLGEPEAPALDRALRAWSAHAGSTLLRVEAERACARYGEEWVARAREGLGGYALLPIDDGVVRAAATVPPATLRTLDAIHLATALSVGHRLGVLFSYDERLCDAARAAGIAVEQPS